MPVITVREATAALTAPGSPFEMVEAVVHGQRLRTWKHAPPTLRSVAEHAARFGERTYLAYEGERYDYRAAFAWSARVARMLVERYGITKGDRVILLMRNCPEWPVVFWAATSIGAIVVPLNAWWQGPELAYAFGDSGARLAVVDGERLDRVESIAREHDVRLLSARAGASTHDALEQVAPSEGPIVELPAIEMHPDDDATLFYTSGTTGKPKGALGTHRNLCTNIVSRGFSLARAALRRGDPIPPPPPDQKASLISVPFFHVTGCHSLLAAGTYAGSKLVMMRKWDPDRALELIERERINAFGGVPSMPWQVLESPRLKGTDTSSVESIAYGGAPAPPELVRRLGEAFPNVRPGNGYGLTESSAIACSISAEEYSARPDSVGPPVPVCDVRTVDDRGNPLPQGSVGELCIRGPNIVRGYWQQVEATTETFVEGWLRTGDIARIDEDGFVYILDRAKDMLIRGGENIYCVEVEDALYAHPEVSEAAVLGQPHPVLGEEPLAVVQLVRGATATEAELRAWVGGRLAAFKVPVRIVLRTGSLPRNENGKIVKRELKRELGLT